jgi:glycosyltransferase involved in cell wall biosynthesis
LKIALCAPADLHGLARYLGRETGGVAPGLGSTATTPLIIELLRRGHIVTIYTLSDGLPEEKMYDWGCLRVFVGANTRFRNLYRPQINYLKRVIREDAPLFVHAHWTYEFALGALASGAPTITTIHDLPWNVFRYFRDTCRAVRLLMAYMVAAKGKSFTAVSPDAARHFSRWLHPGVPVTVIPNFLRDSVFELSETAHSDSMRPLTFVTALQGWSRRKNGTCALRAFRLLRKNVPETRLMMFGADYEIGGAAHRWALEKGLAEGVVFKGATPNDILLKTVASQADVLVHPSLDEAFSVTVLEAMALKKPVIAGIRTPGLRWVLDEGSSGLLVDVLKPEEVAHAMQRLAADPALRQKLSKAAYQKAWNSFRADAVIPQYEALYKEFEAGLPKNAWQCGERRGVA